VGVVVFGARAGSSMALAWVASVVSGAMIARTEAATVMVMRDFMVMTCPLGVNVRVPVVL